MDPTMFLSAAEGIARGWSLPTLVAWAIFKGLPKVQAQLSWACALLVSIAQKLGADVPPAPPKAPPVAVPPVRAPDAVPAWWPSLPRNPAPLIGG